MIMDMTHSGELDTILTRAKEFIDIMNIRHMQSNAHFWCQLCAGYCAKYCA